MCHADFNINIDVQQILPCIRADPNQANQAAKRTIMIYKFIETFHAIKLMSASGMSKEPQRKYFKL